MAWTLIFSVNPVWLELVLGFLEVILLETDRGWLELPLAGTNFHGLEQGWATEVQQWYD